MKLKDLPDESPYTPGDKACGGCMAANIAINVMRVLGKKAVVSVPPSCMSVFAGIFPAINWDVPYFHMQFANLASMKIQVFKLVVHPPTDLGLQQLLQLMVGMEMNTSLKTSLEL